MKKFRIIANTLKDPEGKYTDIVKTKIYEAGAEVVENSGEAEAVLVLGGDGTLLKAVGDNLDREIPYLGVNIGTLGYLSGTDMNDIGESIKHLTEGDYRVEERMMLYGYGAGEKGRWEDHALNDVTITRCGAMSIVRYDLIVNGELLNSYSADGLIISTPTGSTGYNMSAGGPIAEPGSQILILTPICPHTLNTRSIVLGAEARVEVRISDTQRTPVAVQFDGRNPYMMGPGMEVSVKKSEKKARIIRLTRESFLNTLHAKLK